MASSFISPRRNPLTSLRYSAALRGGKLNAKPANQYVGQQVAQHTGSDRKYNSTPYMGASLNPLIVWVYMLIHFTKSVEALDSIVRRGFLYLHNETGVLGPAAWDAFGIDADDQSDGMICFTELLPNETISHQSKFGKFGVAVAKDWLIKNNAQKVMYVPVGSASYKSLVATLKYLAPKSLWGIPTHNLLEAPETRFRATQALTNMKWAQQAGVSDEYITFLETFEWTQTDRDVAQREWRVRNPKPYRFIGQSERQQQIQLLVNCVSDTNVQDEVEGILNYTIDGSLQLSCTGRLSLVLQLPKEQIRAMFCPEQDKKLIELALTNAGLSHIQVIASAND